ncbi:MULTISPECIES: hypothetical protein [unclassified Nocardioides]|uniref:hypothetical protein n=1 Tax=unclassified Nocardioides TaxID=2615069 RepID=UPI000B297F60|nr:MULTISPECIES: hypothetical protein [unclassified Nocardioides]
MRLALVAALAASLAVLGACSGSDDPDEPAAGPTAPRVATTELDAGPVGVADVDGEPWTVLVDEGTVRAVDDDRIAVGDAPLRLVGTPTGVWVTVIRDGTVVRINPSSGTVDQTVRLRPAGSEPEGIAWDGETLWVVDQAHDRVVPLTLDGKQLKALAVDSEPRLVTAGTSGVWVTSFGGSALSLVSDGRARTVPLTGCVGPQGVAEAGGRVWVACTLSGKAVALDVRTLEQVAEVDDVPDADAVVATDDTVYVVGQSGPTVYVIDAATGTLTDTVTLDDAHATSENVGAAIVGDELVVTHPDVRRIYTLPLP